MHCGGGSESCPAELLAVLTTAPPIGLEPKLSKINVNSLLIKLFCLGLVQRADAPSLTVFIYMTHSSLTRRFNEHLLQ